ncbi:MAG: DNA polymerase III subunit delta [Bacteroidota bacterium]
MLFSEVIGQSSIKQRLIDSVKENRVSHALLFAGPEGSGKLALALAFVQYIMCTKKKENDSCGVCPACVKNSKFIHPDTHYIFPIINLPQYKPTICDNFLDKWRDQLTETPYFSINQWLNNLEADNKQAIIYSEESDNIIKKISFKTFESDYKITIIWNADKMNIAFANKILKLLEEPPEKTIFLLLCENPDKLLPTILSRSQIIKIPPVLEEDLMNYLKKNLQYDDIQAYNIAKISEGNYIKMIENINLSDELTFNKESFISMMRTSWSEKATDINLWVENMHSIGREKQKSFFQYSLRMIRENFIFSSGVQPLNKLTDDELEFTKKFSKFIHKDNVIQISNELNSANYHIERNGYARFILFDLVLKLAKLLKT